MKVALKVALPRFQEPAMSDFQRVNTGLHPRSFNPVHLGHAATTPVDPRVIRRMRPYLSEMYGNPASRSHAYGRVGEEAVELAREQVSSLVNGDPHEIVWTSWSSGRACGSRAKCTAASTSAACARGRCARIRSSRNCHCRRSRSTARFSRRGRDQGGRV
ncbi:hypothetical protein HDG34_005166 [Paraburkholderia sp. HC6.4b]|nr:hypothetical protein [Paraburkholderia sp. HC6.4b]MBB5453978.1 hypothetical protein [Paraburkholderia sp. Kb1A]